VCLRDTVEVTRPNVSRVERYGEGSTDASGRGNVSTGTEAELRWRGGRLPEGWNGGPVAVWDRCDS